MENKKITMITMATLAVVAFVFAYVFVVQKQKEKDGADKMMQQNVSQEKIVCNFKFEEEALKKMMETKNVDWCSCIIANEKMKKSCNESGNDSNMYEMGIGENNPEKCNLIKRDDMRASCLSSITSSAEIEKMKKIEDDNKKVNDLMNAATKYISGARGSEDGSRSDVERKASLNKALEAIAEVKKIQPNNAFVQQLEKDASEASRTIK